jgi:hypothetical protein
VAWSSINQTKREGLDCRIIDQARLNRAATTTAMMQVMPTMPVDVASLEGTGVTEADVAVR